MALKKSIGFKNGMSGEYIRISEVYLVNGSLDCLVKYQLWKDQITRGQIGSEPIIESCVSVSMIGDGDVYSKCYNGMKNLSDFNQSEDV